jgi:hypothetical protein
MNIMLNQNVIPYPGIPAADIYLGPQSEADRVSLLLRYRITHFDFDDEDWGASAASALYKSYAAAVSLKERQQLYARVLDDVVKGEVRTTALLAFAIFEPHMKITGKAVRDYLTYRICDIEDEFAGVHEVIGILANEDTVNKGAVLAGLVSVGDRRVNAVARAARHLLSATDIKSFSRVQMTTMRSSSVEFCLDWLLELNQQYCQDAVGDIASALMLMVVHDEHGVVEDRSEINYVGFKTTKILQTQSFESYYSEIMPILKHLKKCDRFDSAMTMVIELWDEHRAEAVALREKDKSLCVG